MESRPEPRIVGGLFGLAEMPNLSNSCMPPFLKDNENFLLVNARSGISLLIELLSPTQVWMPSYLCDSMLQAIDENVTRIRFYEVNYDLIVSSLEWINNIQPGDLVIPIDYFGFPCDSSCAILAKEQGAWVLEDACQALLSGGVGQFSDFVLFSPRKFLGVPDGGILTVNCEVDFHGVELRSPPAEWWLKALFVTVLRREFDIHGGSRRWFELFQEVEANHPIGHYAISELSRMLLMHSFDYSMIARRRVDNYQVLAERLGDLALFPHLPSKTVPLGFPIRVKNRNRVRQVLFDHEIYPPVHWPIRGIVPEEFRDSHRLAAEIMTLPCDQRYDSGDMDRMAQLVLKELRK